MRVPTYRIIMTPLGRKLVDVLSDDGVFARVRKLQASSKRWTKQTKRVFSHRLSVPGVDDRDLLRIAERAR